MSRGELGEVEQRMLALEKLHFKYAGAKEQEIRARFDISPTHYYQLLNVLIDTDDALAWDPMLVRRLRRLRSTRRRVATRRGSAAGRVDVRSNDSRTTDSGAASRSADASSKEGHE
ncbi:DUF3263 domain-containing protein [Zhihengliuella salsuginis]|uniref:DUF3263 domain-containing protein n=1 Tax=Zhihengliuella salsuginis TaxID=578222 RepID=A0ABQ3GLE6_9MICC|nr:DUF3263 domain-containing protein [Zhihengliuella salsuginis]GHD10626.1 hypothetical protein GCM10008096_24380 [Zhihengliuella salsuginis]